MWKISIYFIAIFWSFNAFAQTLTNYGDQKEARNIMIVEAVSSYKLGDEKLAKQFESLQNNPRYHQKLQKIMKNLNNSKLRNTKNKEVLQILDDAGNRLYNLLAN